MITENIFSGIDSAPAVPDHGLSVTFTIGEPVPWPHAPGGLAQVEELLRSNVVILWKDEQGKNSRAKLNAFKLAKRAAAYPPLLPAADVRNPYDRASLPTSKTFTRGEK